MDDDDQYKSVWLVSQFTKTCRPIAKVKGNSWNFHRVDNIDVSYFKIYFVVTLNETISSVEYKETTKY